MKCSAPAHAESTLRCGKCEQIVCPKCLVQTPVGARCRECARLYKLPTYRVSAKQYLIASLAGLGTAAVLGAVWGFVWRFVPFFYLSLVMAGGIGAIIAEAVSRPINRKRGTGLAVIAALCVVVAYLVALFVPWGLRFGFFDLVAVIVGIVVAVGRVR